MSHLSFSSRLHNLAISNYNGTGTMIKADSLEMSDTRDISVKYYGRKKLCSLKKFMTEKTACCGMKSFSFNRSSCPVR